MTRSEIFDAISKELDRAYSKHGRSPWQRHQFYGIITEEFKEMEAEIFKGGTIPFDEESMKKEIIQVASMCFRYLETGNPVERDAFGVPYNR